MRRTPEIGGFFGVRLLAAFLSVIGQGRRLGTFSRDQIMRNLKLLAGAGIFTLFATTSAYAAGSIGGTTISNTATVAYSVGGVSQPTVSNTPTVFTVDRKVVFRVDETAPTGTTTVAPGQSAAVTTFTVANTSNFYMDFGLSVAQPAGGTATHGGTDNFDATGVTIWVDTNGNGTLETTGGTPDTQINYIDELAPDTSRVVFVLANIPAGRATNDVAGVTLTAQARDGASTYTQATSTWTVTTGAQGAVSTNTAGVNTAGMDTVLADTAYDANNTASDGLGVAKDDYTVSNAAISLTKTIKPVSDGFNTAVNAKMIPGATVQYCIIAANAAGGATATGVSITDPVPSTLSIVAGSLRINGTATAGVCNADGVAGGTIAGQNVSSGTLNNIAAGANVTIYFNATIN
jgi:uncharacterized repeat protein (TIGR01451 family)